MRIRVLANYGGAMTNEARIEPGEYDLDAPELFGAGQYLLDNSHAVALDNEPDEPAALLVNEDVSQPVPLPKKPTPPDRRPQRRK